MTVTDNELIEGADLSAVLERGGDIPLHRQLKEHLRSRVSSGELAPGTQLCGEHVLSAQYGVSRPVVRQALADLQRENVIERRRGLGTFVAERRTSQGLVQSLGGLADDIAAIGRHLRSDVRRQTIELADTEIAGRLQIDPGTPVVALDRLRFVDDEPWVFTVSHVPVVLAPDLVSQDFSSQSLYALLRGKYGHTLVSSHRTVEAVRSDAGMAKALQIRDGDPVLKLQSTVYNADRLPVETFVAFHRGDRSRFEVFLTASDGVGPHPPLIRLV